MADVYQSQILVFGAEASIADIHRRIEQQENLVSILLGRNRGDIRRGAALISQTVRAEVQAGLPSSLLERRPDLRAAEQELVVANADIAQARRNELLSAVQLCRALGGGWTEPAAPQTASAQTTR